MTALRAWLAFAAAVILTAAPSARAEEAGGYAARAKATIAALLQNRSFTPQAGCDDAAACRALLARLAALDFTVVEPAARSERLDLPDYARLRKRCPALDPMHITSAHRLYAPTRGFAVYHLDLPGTRQAPEEVLVFRAQHYVPVAGRAGDDQTPLTPGTFVSVSLRGCRLLSTARAEDGDWLAKHNAIGDSDHASELLELGGRYVVLNLAPVAGPREPKASWSYMLELWDLGPRADADRRKQRRVYSFISAPPTAEQALAPRRE
jgi:hypothetical protein